MQPLHAKELKGFKVRRATPEWQEQRDRQDRKDPKARQDRQDLRVWQEPQERRDRKDLREILVDLKAQGAPPVRQAR